MFTRKWVSITVLPVYGKNGELAEWLKALAWKAGNWETGSGVRIPHSPPILSIDLSLAIKVKIINISGN